MEPERGEPLEVVGTLAGGAVVVVAIAAGQRHPVAVLAVLGGGSEVDPVAEHRHDLLMTLGPALVVLDQVDRRRELDVPDPVAVGNVRCPATGDVLEHVDVRGPVVVGEAHVAHAAPIPAATSAPRSVMACSATMAALEVVSCTTSSTREYSLALLSTVSYSS